jgi:putative FmdB family regulatory protein
MPIYEYSCPSCGREFEELIRGDERPVCPGCGEIRVQRQLSVPAAHSGGSADSTCPARDACGMSHCCRQNCGLGG